MSLGTAQQALPRLPARAGSLREVWSLAYPVALTQLSATLMGVIDSAMVGRLGATELAAVGFGAVWLWTIFSLFFGTATGVQTFVSQYEGAGSPRRCGDWAWQGFWVVVPAALAAALLLWPNVDRLLVWLGPSDALREGASVYVRTRLPGEVGFVLWTVTSSFFRGIGDTRTPLYVTLGANALNALLDYGLIFGRLGLPEWGLAGAATATAVAQWSGAVVLLGLFLVRPGHARYEVQPRAPRWRAARRFLRIGAPIGGQWFLNMTSFAVFTTVVARMGDASMAASQAFVMLLSLSFMQALGISVAAQTLVGRYKGARKPEAVQRSFRSALVLGVALAFGVALLFVSIPGPLLRIFTDDPALVTLGRPLLLIGALFQLCDALAIISQGALRGAGDTRWPFVVETLLGWGFFLPLAWFLGVGLGWGLTGAWAGACISLAVTAAILLHRFHSGAWQHLEI